MDVNDGLKFLSDNHRYMILLGGVLCFIAMYLPSWSMFSASTLMPENLTISISSISVFWLYLILISGIFFGYFFSYGPKYPFLFLGIGIFLILYTLYVAQITILKIHFPLSYGIYLEFIGSLTVAIGGYLYYKNSEKPRLF